MKTRSRSDQILEQFRTAAGTSQREINERLERILSDAFESVWHAAQEHRVTLRTAAYILACRRVLEARQLRGIYP